MWEFKWIWKLDIALKIKIFLWQLFHKVVPVREVLHRRGVVVPIECPLCLQGLEYIHHLFVECPVTRHVWDEIQQYSWSPVINLSDNFHALVRINFLRIFFNMLNGILLLWIL